MKNTLKIKILFLILTVPLLLSNERCIIEDIIINIVEQIKAKRNPHLHKNPVYVSHLTMIDGASNMSFFNSDSIKLINSAVIQGIHLAQKQYKFIKHNARGHTLKDTEENAKRLKEIVLNRSLTKERKMDKIINELMGPAKIDIIVSGVFYEGNRVIKIKPFIINRRERTIVTKITQFDKHRFICDDPTNKGIKVLCKSAYEEIAKLVEELLLQL